MHVGVPTSLMCNLEQVIETHLRVLNVLSAQLLSVLELLLECLDEGLLVR